VTRNLSQPQGKTDPFTLTKRPPRQRLRSSRLFVEVNQLLVQVENFKIQEGAPQDWLRIVDTSFTVLSISRRPDCRCCSEPIEWPHVRWLFCSDAQQATIIGSFVPGRHDHMRAEQFLSI
jgi:hypothetical protein